MTALSAPPMRLRRAKRLAVPVPRMSVGSDPAKPGRVMLDAPVPGEREALRGQLRATFATQTDAAADRMLEALLDATRTKDAPAVSEGAVNGALAMLHGIAPSDEVEAMLVSQMIVTHHAAMTALRRVAFSETIPQQDSNGNLATKLLRTFAAQLEALHRYRNKGEQKVTVEHVHVHAGGQAIVGHIETKGPGAPPDSGGQARA